MISWTPGMSLKDIEKLIVRKAVSFYRSEEAAARSLGIKTDQLLKKISKYKEEDEELKNKQAEIMEKEQEFVDRSRGINRFI